MIVEFYVSVRIGEDEFIKQFDSEKLAMDCFDRLSAVSTDDIAIEGNLLTCDSNTPLDSVTVHRVVNQGTLGDPNRQ